MTEKESTSDDARLDRVIAKLRQMIDGSRFPVLELSGRGDAIDVLAAHVNELGARLELKQMDQAHASERLQELVEAIITMAGLDFDTHAPVHGDGGLFDAVAVGLRLLGEELRASTVSREYVQGIVDSMADVLVVTDSHGCIRTANAAAQKLLAAPGRELAGRSLDSVLAQGPGASPELVHRLQMGTDRTLDAEFAGPDGECIPVQIRASVLRGTSGETRAVVIVGRDMRETRRLLALEAAAEAERNNAAELRRAYDELRDTQRMLIQTAKMTALGELAAGVVDELGQPLSNIKLIVQTIVRDMTAGRYDLGDVTEDIREVAHAAGKMAGIIDHMRAFARRPEDSPRVRVDVDEAVTNALGLVWEELRVRDIGVRRELGPDLPVVLGDPNNLEQIFINLLTNARDAVCRRLEVCASPPGEVVIRSYAAGDGRVCVTVEDNGDGVPSALRARIFDPFFTTKDVGHGVGLGLSIAQRVVAECGGTIELDASVRDRTVFRVSLPPAPGPDGREPGHDAG
jgi:PAS domain S-box-containing protein